MAKFQAYKQKDTITVTPDNIATQLIAAYGGQSDTLLEHGEALLDIIAHTSIDNFKPDTTGIINALYYLNYRLEAVRKTISFWDAYQIRETIDDRDELLGQLANLPPNSSVVSNLRIPFKWLNSLQQEETVYRGDLFIKDYQGNIHLIHGSSQGTYQPAEDWIPTEQSGSTYQLIYTYTESPKTEVKTNLTIKGQPQGYNNTLNMVATTDPAYPTKDSTTATIASIKPVIKYYWIDNNNNREQIIFDTSFAINSGHIDCYNPSSVDVICEVK